jgi:hypothetical protein
MAKSKRKSSSGGNGSNKGSSGETRGSRTTIGPKDAIALLKADHREVEGYFKEFE